MHTAPKLSIRYITGNVVDPFYKYKVLPLDGELTWANSQYSLFKKYRHLLTWFANTYKGREFLDLPYFSYKIGLLTPNGYHTIVAHDDEKLYGEATFYSRNIFVPKLFPILSKIDLYLPYLSSFEQEQQLLLWGAGIKKDIPYTLRSTFLTTDTFYPDPDAESTSVDGLVFRDAADETWATIRAGAGTGALDSNASTTYVGWSTSATTNQFAVIRRAIFLFDSSSIPDTNTVSAATFSVFGTAKADTQSDTPALALVSSNPATNTALIGADYSTLGSTRFATDIDYASYSTTGYNDFTLNSDGRNNISKTGISKFGLKTDNDLDNVAPNWTASVEPAYMQGYYADQADVTNDPKLVATHDTTTSTSTSTTSTSTSTTSTSTSTSTTSTSTSTSRTTSTSSSTSTSTTSTSTSRTTSTSTTTSSSTSTTSTSTSTSSSTSSSTSTTSTSSSTTMTSTTTTLDFVFSVDHGDFNL